MFAATVVFLAPFTKISILPFAKSLDAKYLSVTLKFSVAVLVGASTVELIFSINGSTTSTIVSEPVPAGMLTPDVIVVVTFWLPAVSCILLAGIATVITPL